MKIAIVIPVLCFAVSAAFAQQQPPKTLLEIIKENHTGKVKQPILMADMFMLPQSGEKLTLLTTTSSAKIYALPQDNMPCAVPDMKQVIPIPTASFRSLHSNMPNAPIRKN